MINNKGEGTLVKGFRKLEKSLSSEQKKKNLHYLENKQNYDRWTHKFTECPCFKIQQNAQMITSDVQNKGTSMTFMSLRKSSWMVKSVFSRMLKKLVSILVNWTNRTLPAPKS
jgi:beta-N-acetylglucosaminidase